MEITIHNKDMIKVGVLSNTLPDAVHFYDDEWMIDLETGSGTFSCKVSKSNPLYQRIKFDQASRLSFRMNERDYVYSIIRMQEERDYIQIDAIYFSMELQYEKAPAVKPSAPQGILWYLQQSGITNYTQITVGRNEVLDRTRTIEYSGGSDSKLARLLDICRSFDAELEFETRLHDDGRLKAFILNIYREHDSEHQGVGRRRTDLPILEYRTGLQGVRRKVDYTEIINAVSVIGKDGLSFTSAAAEYRNDVGRVEFVKKGGDAYYRAPISASLFPAQITQPGLSNSDSYISKTIQTEYTTVGQLMAHGLKVLRENAYPKMTFEIDVTSTLVSDRKFNLSVGDTWQVKCDDLKDDEGKRLLIEFRISRITRSFCNPERNKLEFKNYRRIKSEVSSDLLSRVKSMVATSIPGRYRQEVAPVNPIKETVWQHTGTTAKVVNGVVVEPQTDYRWSGEQWEKVEVNSNNLTVEPQFITKEMIKDNAITTDKLQVETVSAISSDLGEINGGSLLLAEEKTKDGTAYVEGLAIEPNLLLSVGEPKEVNGTSAAVTLSSGSLRFSRIAPLENRENLRDYDQDTIESFGKISYRDSIFEIESRYDPMNIVSNRGGINLVSSINGIYLNGPVSIPSGYVTIGTGDDTELIDLSKINAPVQTYRLTGPKGEAMNSYSADFNMNASTGFFHKGSTALNNPSGTWGMLQVIASGRNIIQLFAERDGSRRLFMRSMTNGVWQAWVEFAQNTHSNLVNTGWQTAGMEVSWVKYKKIGDQVVIDLLVPANTANRKIGTLPSIYRPGHNLMLPATRWRTDGLNAALQVEAGGTLKILNAGTDNVWTQVSFAI